MEIIIKDDVAIGTDKQHAFSIHVAKNYCTLAELIQARVYAEVEQYNRDRSFSFRALTGAPRATGAFEPLDAEKMYYLALAAFKKHQFFVLVNDDQKECLDDQIELAERMEVLFIRLTPLAGG